MEAQPGLPTAMRTLSNIVRVKACIHRNQRLTMRMITEEHINNHDYVHKVLTENLNMKKGWILLHDNASSYSPFSVREFLATHIPFQYYPNPLIRDNFRRLIKYRISKKIVSLFFWHTSYVFKITFPEKYMIFMYTDTSYNFEL